METALKTTFVSVEEYLSGEEVSDTRHEYVAGVVYAMAGGSDAHNAIGLNLIERLRPQLRSGPCRLYAFDVKVSLFVDGKQIFYYPDIIVTCNPRDTEKYFKEYPSLIVEVLSESTERIDRHEKFRSYTNIETLQEYVLVAQDRMEVTIFRRTGNWKPEILNGAAQEMWLESVKFKMPVSAIYEGVNISGLASRQAG